MAQITAGTRDIHHTSLFLASHVGSVPGGATGNHRTKTPRCQKTITTATIRICTRTGFVSGFYIFLLNRKCVTKVSFWWRDAIYLRRSITRSYTRSTKQPYGSPVDIGGHRPRRPVSVPQLIASYFKLTTSVISEMHNKPTKTLSHAEMQH